MNYNEHNQTNDLLDSLASNSFIPLILLPTRITLISDHLPQFAIIPNIFGNISGNKSNIFESGWSNFHSEKFILDYFSVDWEDLLKN